MSLEFCGSFSTSGSSNAKTESKGVEYLLITGVLIDTVQNVGRHMLRPGIDLTDPSSEENVRGKTKPT
jgi:hypothetical protein